MLHLTAWGGLIFKLPPDDIATIEEGVHKEQNRDHALLTGQQCENTQSRMPGAL